MSMSPLFTMIIPTRDRDGTLKHSLATAMDQVFENCEILVSDSAARPETRSLVEDAQRRDPRVRYICPDVALGMAEHWDFALRHANGAYVIFMGDDDGIYPGALAKIAAEIDRLDKPPLITWPQSTFMWPGVPDIFYPGLLSVPATRATTIVDSRQNLPQAPYRLFKLLARTYPTIYNKSAFSRTLLDQVRADGNGNFFRSRIPDIYSGVIASVYVDRIPVLGEPLMINAQSARSNGIAFTQPPGQGDEEAKSFLAESTIPIHPEAGGRMSSLLGVLWWETALQARDATGRPVPLPEPESVVRSALFAAHAIADDANFAREVAVLKHIADRGNFTSAFQRWLRLAKRQPVSGRIQRAGYDLRTDTLFVDTTSMGVKTIADAVKVAAAISHTMSNFSAAGWKAREGWRYYSDYLGKRLSLANVVRYATTRS